MSFKQLVVAQLVEQMLPTLKIICSNLVIGIPILFTVHCIEKTKKRGLEISVTRFGEILPLWQIIKCLWQFYEGLFSIWEKLLPTLAIFGYNWATFHCYKWTNNENYKSHLLTLL